jgi:hypothetical protein
MADKLSRLLPKLLYMGGKDRPHRLVNTQSSLSQTGRLDRGTGRSDRPYTWLPKDACSEGPKVGNWKLNMAKNQGSIPKPKVTFDMLFD